MYYKITITKTSKGIGSKDDYQIFDNEVKTFATKELALDWLKDEYNCWQLAKPLLKFAIEPVA